MIEEFLEVNLVTFTLVTSLFCSKIQMLGNDVILPALSQTVASTPFYPPVHAAGVFPHVVSRFNGMFCGE